MKKATYRVSRKKRRPHWGRIFGALLVLVVIIAGTVALANLLGRDIPDAPPPADAGGTDAVLPADDAAADAPAQDAAAALHLMETGWNQWLGWPGDSSVCFYSYERLPSTREIGGLNLKYLDFAAGQERYLCSDPACSHDSAACTSYLPGNYCWAYTMEEGLYLFGYDPDAEDIAWVERRDPDGSNARRLFAGTGSGWLNDARIAADAQTLYFVVEYYDNQTEIHSEQLYGIDRTSGEVSLRCQLPDNHDWVGCCGQYLLTETWDSGLYTMHAVDLQGQVTQALHMPPSYADTGLTKMTDTGLLYYFNKGEHRLEEYDLYTGEVRTVLENCPEGWDFVHSMLEENVIMASYVEGTRADGSYTREQFYYLVNVADGSFSPLTLKEPDDYKGNLLRVLAVYGDRYLVLEGYREVGRVTCPIYAFISKQDYCDGKAEFMTFEPV